MSPATGVPEYEVHAIRYGRHDDRLLRENFIPPLKETVDLHDAPMPMDFFVWVLRGGGRTIVVDTGFDARESAARGRGIVFPVEDGLMALGIAPGTVRDVIITHMHWDHAGNHDLFPNARYHLQAREMSYCTGPCMCHPMLRSTFTVDDVTAMVRRVFDGRVQFHDGTSEVAPGVTVHLVGGHSQGLQIVRVWTRRGWVVLASDASHYYANIDQGRPFPIVSNVAEMLDGFGLIRSLAASADHYIPGHDPLVLRRYAPSLSADMPHIVRLDGTPSKS
ncbi:N-acyl homoserine lactonase family protein [Psychromarinibacter sp. S121]|uniref:N-acyl homoserine lactonase family protein n=1 Tax=Psychromarinibacter sp. S121 TaxID=3415127 RepID=UPI003C7DE4AE